MIIQSVTSGVTNYLRSLIITGKLRPESKLNEIEISKELGVSRPPLREAFRKLESENLVIAKPRRGVFVAPMSVENCDHIYEARKMLECEAVRLLQSKNVTCVPAIEEALKESQKCVLLDPQDTKEVLNYFIVMSAFHRNMIEATGNEWIIYFYKTLSSALTRYQVLYLHVTGSREASIADHQSIYEKIRLGFHDEAKQEIITHINRTKMLLSEELPVSCSEMNIAEAQLMD